MIARAVMSAAQERQVRDFQWRRLLQIFEAWGRAVYVILSDPSDIASDIESDGPPSLVSDDYSEGSGQYASDSPFWDSGSDIS